MTLQRLRPIVLGSLYYKSGALLDRFLASWTGTGMLALLHFAERLHGAAYDVFRRSLVSPYLPRMSEHVRQGDWSSYRGLCVRRLVVVALASLLAFASMATAGRPLLRLLIGHGGLTVENVHLLWYLLLLMGGYLVGGALNYVLAQALYAMGNTTTPAKIGMIGFTVGIPLKIAGLIAWNVQGLALASGVQQLINLLLFLVAWRRSLARASILANAAEVLP